MGEGGARLPLGPAPRSASRLVGPSLRDHVGVLTGSGGGATFWFTLPVAPS